MRNRDVEVSHRLLGVKDLDIPLKGPRAKSYKAAVSLSFAAATAVVALAVIAMKW